MGARNDLGVLLLGQLRVSFCNQVNPVTVFAFMQSHGCVALFGGDPVAFVYVAFFKHLDSVTGFHALLGIGVIEQNHFTVARFGLREQGIKVVESEFIGVLNH